MDRYNSSSFQRQLTIQPMDTKPFKKTFKGGLLWFLWKIGLVIYVLCSALPMIGYIVCLFVISIKRETSIIISIVMMAMLHPLVTIVIGMFAKIIGQLLCKNYPKFFKNKILERMLTYSINLHFTIIAGLTIYFNEIWIISEKAARFAFSSKSYDQCTCEILDRLDYGYLCANLESNRPFQNAFLSINGK